MSVAGGAGKKNPKRVPEYGPHDDPFLPQPPTSAIQVLAWAPKDYRLAAGCWDGSIILWEVQVEKGERLIHRAANQPGPFFTADNFRCPGAVLDLAWHPDGLVLYAACTDGAIYGIFFDVGDVQVIGKHKAPVKTVNWCPQADCLMSGSWDRTLRFWKRTDDITDGQRGMQHTCVKVTTTPERVYAADVHEDMAVVVIAGNLAPVLIYSVASMDTHTLVRTQKDPLGLQKRCVATFDANPNTGNGPGYVVGGIEGRCTVGYFDENIAQDANFTFKCHRDAKRVFAINSVHFHPHHKTFATASSDGTFAFWDKDAKCKIKAPTPEARGSLTCGRFSADGTMYAYAQSYDWSQGDSPKLEAAVVDCVRLRWTHLGAPGADQCAPTRRNY
eukprot:m.66062 g.66062  ORF g.66062 m.66062 type:complete len:387 (+) comp8335_c0_seq2:240-1400(+)